MLKMLNKAHIIHVNTYHTLGRIFIVYLRINRDEPISVQSMLQPFHPKWTYHVFENTVGRNHTTVVIVIIHFQETVTLECTWKYTEGRSHINSGNVTRPFQRTVNLPGIRDHTLGRIFIVHIRIHTEEKPYQCSQPKWF